MGHSKCIEKIDLLIRNSQLTATFVSEAKF